MSNQKYILALDQATIDTGWALFENQQLKDYGVFTPKGTLEERLVKLRIWVQEMVTKYKDNIKVAFEDIQLQNTSKKFNTEMAITTYKKLAWVQGVLIELLTSLQVPYTIVYSTSWKSTCNIKGADRNTQKANAAAYVNATFGISPKQDACDAICIGQHIIKSEAPPPFEWGM